MNEALPQMDVKGRLARLYARLADANCDALVISKTENIQYLTGFTGSAGTLVVKPGAALFVTDGRYKDQAAAQLAQHEVDATVEIAQGGSGLELIDQFVSVTPRVGLESDTVTWTQMRRYADRFKAELVPTSGLVEHLRRTKDEGELARIERACDIADVALAQVKERLRDGITESEFAAELEFEMRQRGSSAPAFSTIVASGPNSALPHARPTNREIGKGELIVVDFGATVEGYRSDMTRTFCVGELDQELAALVDAVFTAQRAGIHAVSAEATGADVDEACRSSLRDAGYGDVFLHSTGHGVGLEIHEAPWVAAGSADILPPGTIVTVEPGAYLSGRGGVRIEDTVVVTANGARILTKSTKDHTL